MPVFSEDFKEFMKYFKEKGYCRSTTRVSEDEEEHTPLVDHPFEMFCLDKMKEHSFCIGDECSTGFDYLHYDNGTGESERKQSFPKSVDGIIYKIVPGTHYDKTKLFLVEFKGGDFDGSEVRNQIQNLNDFLDIEENIYKVCPKPSIYCPFNHNNCPNYENNNFTVCHNRAESYFEFCHDKIHSYEEIVDDFNILEQLNNHNDPIKSVKYFLNVLEEYVEDSIMLDMTNKPTESLNMVLPVLYHKFCEEKAQQDLSHYKLKNTGDFRNFIDHCAVFLYIVIDGKYANLERSNYYLRSSSTRHYYNKLKNAGIIWGFNIIYNDDFCEKLLLREGFFNSNYCEGCSKRRDCDIYNDEINVSMPTFDSLKN